MKRIPLKKIELPDDVLAKATTDSKGELVIPEARQFQVPYLPAGLKWNISSDEQGDDVLLIRVMMSKDTTAGDFSNRFFGLTGRVRNALGDEMRGLFPVIRPV